MLHALRTSFPVFSFIEVHRNRFFSLKRCSTLFVTRFMRKAKKIAACMTSHTAAHYLWADSLVLAPVVNNKLLASCSALQMT